MNNKNYLAAILRILACYAVVSVHFRPTLPFSDLSVPIFVVMAFVFWSPSCGLRHRITRLLIPYVTWGMVGCCARFVRDRSLSYKLLVMQLTCGQGGNSPLYFLLLLMILSALVYCVYKMTRHWIAVLCVFAVLAMILQYSGINVAIFSVIGFDEYYSTTFGRFAEFIPYVALGSIIGNRIKNNNDKLDMLTYFRMRALRWILAVVAIMAMIFKANMATAPGFGYSGIPGFLAVACIMAVVFSVKLRGNRFWDICFWFSTFTGGIYYIHKLVGSILVCLHLRGVGLTLVTFVFSFAIVFAISKQKGLNVLVK